MSFLKAEAERRLQNNPLMKLNDLVNWEDIGVILRKMCRSGYGPIFTSYNSKTFIPYSEVFISYPFVV